MSLAPRRGPSRHTVPSSPIVDNAKKRKLELLGDEWAAMEIAVPPQASSPRRGRSAGLPTPPLTPTLRILSPWNKKNELSAVAEALKSVASEEGNLATAFASLLQGEQLDHRAVSGVAKKFFDVAQQRLAALQALAACCLESEVPRVEPTIKHDSNLVTLAPLVLSVPPQLMASHHPRVLQARAVLSSESSFLHGSTAQVTSNGLVVFDCLAVPVEVVTKEGSKSLRVHLEAVVDSTAQVSILQPITSPISVPLPLPLSSPPTSESSSPYPRYTIMTSVGDQDADVTVSHDIFTSFSGSSSSTPSSDERPKKRPRVDSDASSPLVDITPLLPLPQKEAATRLGISESMLCKRFKECTQRKWPYRQLCKLDKAIASLLRSRKRGSNPVGVPDEALLLPNDLAKLRSLRKQREAILAPVQIRVTAASEETSAPSKKVPRASARQARGSGRFASDFFNEEDASSQVEDHDVDDGDDEDGDEADVREFEVQWEIRRDDEEDEEPSPYKRGGMSTRRVHELDKMELAELEDDAAVVVLSLLSQGAMI